MFRCLDSLSKEAQQTLVLSTRKYVILSTVLSLKMLYVVRTDQKDQKKGTYFGSSIPWSLD